MRRSKGILAPHNRVDERECVFVCVFVCLFVCECVRDRVRWSEREMEQVSSADSEQEYHPNLHTQFMYDGLFEAKEIPVWMLHYGISIAVFKNQISMGFLGTTPCDEAEPIP